MLYDLLADFYEKSSDRHPKYIVLMGTYNENTFDEMKILGFQEDSDSNASFQDYVMDGANENFLKEYYCCPLKVSEQRDIHPQCCCNGIADDFSEGKPLS